MLQHFAEMNALPSGRGGVRKPVHVPLGGTLVLVSVVSSQLEIENVIRLM